MPPNSKWQVKVGKDTFILNGKEASVLKQAIITGNRGIIFFKDIAINIPMIETIVMVDSGFTRIESNNTDIMLSKEERKAGRKKINEIRQILANKIRL